ncbi:cobalt ECF transporter T component CbiQ [Sinanaerobacter chloroacetimidivorans]|nr:cobalt ECF transporter T component CbiQ [Sinanaerobacter chloroacetimidivorans]
MIDKLAYSSRLRDKSPALKASLAVGTLLICVGARSFMVSLITIIVMGGLTVLSSRISLLKYLKLMSIPFGFMVLSTIAIVINLSDKPMDLLSVPVGSGYLAISYHSLTEGILLVMVALASVSCLYFLTLSTAMLDILEVLRRLHCPILMVELMMLIYRYIFVILDMASAITTSQHCRLGNKDFMTELRSMGQMLAVLLVRSLKRSSQLFDAMESRCYDGEIRVLRESYTAEKRELIGTAGFLAAMLAIAILCRLKGIGLW